MASVFATLFQILLLFLSFIMIVLILLQRGRGGGLAGAFGGMGGQSAFGTKAGDVFTRITIVVAILWVVSAGLMGLTARAAQNAKSKAFLESGADADADATGGENEKTGDVKSNAAPATPAGSAPVATPPLLPMAPEAGGTTPSPDAIKDGAAPSASPPPATNPPETTTPQTNAPVTAPPPAAPPASPAPDSASPTDGPK